MNENGTEHSVPSKHTGRSKPRERNPSERDRSKDLLHTELSAVGGVVEGRTETLPAAAVATMEAI